MIINFLANLKNTSSTLVNFPCFKRSRGLCVICYGIISLPELRSKNVKFIECKDKSSHCVTNDCVPPLRDNHRITSAGTTTSALVSVPRASSSAQCSFSKKKILFSRVFRILSYEFKKIARYSRFSDFFYTFKVQIWVIVFESSPKKKLPRPPWKSKQKSAPREKWGQSKIDPPRLASTRAAKIVLRGGGRDCDVDSHAPLRAFQSSAGRRSLKLTLFFHLLFFIF